MGIIAGEIGMNLRVDGKSLRKQIVSESRAASSNMEGIFGASFKKIGALAATAFSIHALAKFTASCLELGSNLSEVQNVVDTAFPSMSSQVDAFAKSAMSSFGLGETMAKQFMGTFGAMSKSFGFSEAAAFDMSATLTGLAGDVASFYNLDPTEAYTKLKSVFTGETETLKELGVVMTQNALDEYAMANGYGKTTAKMSEQEKVALRLAFVTETLGMASGDFIKTQDSWANQTRVLSLRFDQLKASLGKGFIAIFNPIVKGINWVLANLQPLADSFASLMEMLTGSSPGVSGGALAATGGALDSTTDSADGLGSGLDAAGSKGEKAAKKIEKAFAKVDTINKLSFGSADKDSGGDGGGASSESVADAVDFPKAEQQGSAFSGMLDGIIKEFKRLSDIFVYGFRIGFGDSFKDLDRIKGYLVSIKGGIIDIFADGRVASHAKIMVDSIVRSLGKQVGAIASIGTTMATLITGSIATYLQQNAGFLTDRIVWLIDMVSVSAYFVGNFATVLADIASVFAGSKAVQIGANLIQALANGFLNGITLLSDIGLRLFTAVTQPIIDNKDAIKTAIDQMLTPLVTLTGTIATKMTDWDSFVAIFGTAAAAIGGIKAATLLTAPAILGLGGTFKTVGIYASTFFGGIKEGSGIITTMQAILPSSVSSFSAIGKTIAGIISPVGIAVGAITALAAGFGYLYATSESFRDGMNVIFASIAENISGVVTGLVQIITTIWSEGIQPVVDSTIAAFTNLWDNGLSVFVANVSEFAANLINFVLSIWNNAINPFINLLLNTFLPIFTKVWDGVLAVAVPIIETIMAFVNSLMGPFNDLMVLLNDSVLPTFKVVFDGASAAVSGFYDFIEPIIDGAIKAFGGITDFLVGVFTGDWDRIWSGIGEIFSGVWGALKGVVKNAWEGILGLFENGGRIFSGVVDGIATVFKNIVNCIISGINTVIAWPFNKINGFLNDIKDIDIPLVGKPFSGFWDYNPIWVPQIPMLAQGGYVKANQPQLAMIGDNRHYGEIVTPENKMYEVVSAAIAAQKGRGDTEGMATVIALLKSLLEAILSLNLSVDIDRKKLAILLRSAEKEIAMIGG